MTKGLTLLEVLIIAVILAMLLTLSFTALGRFRDVTELQQAQQLIVQEVNRARSSTYRSGISQTVRWSTDRISIQADGEEAQERRISPSGRITLTESGSFRYTAPYGTTSTPVSGVILELESRSGRTAEVLIYGIRGMVFSY